MQEIDCLARPCMPRHQYLQTNLHRHRIAAPLIFPSAPRRWEGGAGNGEDEGSSSIRRALHNAWTLRRGTRFVSGCGWKEGEDDAMESSHQREQAAMC
jgi:hypothetical protein